MYDVYNTNSDQIFIKHKYEKHGANMLILDYHSKIIVPQSGGIFHTNNEKIYMLIDDGKDLKERIRWLNDTNYVPYLLRIFQQ